MGYTHYWYTHRDAPADAYGRTALDAKRQLAYGEAPVCPFANEVDA